MILALQCERAAEAGESVESKLPRVLFVIPGPSTGPSMVFARRQVQAVKDQGCPVEMFFLASRTSVSILIKEMLRFRRLVRQWRPEIVHAQFGTVTALFCAIGCIQPLVICFRGSDLNPCPSMSWLRSALGRLCSQVAALRASAIVCVSRRLKSRLWWRRARVRVIPSGVDLSVFHPIPRDEARLLLKWREDEKVVLFNAGLSPAIKRLDRAQGAVEIARQICGPMRLHVLDGTADPGDVPVMMNAADCLVLTSDWEGSPTIIQEALACGLPVVAVDVGDVPEMLNGVSPSEVTSRRVDEIGEALARILLDRRRSNGPNQISPLSLPTIGERLCALYRDARQMKHKGS